jgi:hypothetical protein
MEIMVADLQSSECCRENLTGVQLAPDTTDRMLSAEYWLCKAGAAGSILLNEVQIQSFNRQVRKHMECKDCI